MENVLFGLLLADDLMSLLDGGIHSDHPSVIIDSDAMFNEDMFGYSTLRGRTSGRARSGKQRGGNAHLFNHDKCISSLKKIACTLSL